MKFSNEQWKKIDNNVNHTERLTREQKNSTVDSSLRESVLEVNQYGIATSKLLAEMGVDFDINAEIASINNTQAIEEESKDLTGELEKVLISMRWENLSNALKKSGALDTAIDQLNTADAKVLRKMNEIQDKGGIPIGEKKLHEKIEEQIDQLVSKKQEIKSQNPESWYGLNLKELKDLKRDLKSGRIIETEYVKGQSTQIEKHILAGAPVFIHGHLGAGKTEIAMHTARKMLQHRTDLVETKLDTQGNEMSIDHRNALIISGSKHTSLSELYGHKVLTTTGAESAENEAAYKKYLDKIDTEFTQWQSENPDASKEDADFKRETISALLIARLNAELTKSTVTDFYTGPIYQAMEQGRPVILDEVNAIPHEVLISLNHLLTRKPGETITIQQDSGKTITVKEGFGFILTGNLNKGGNKENYIGRQDLDPAFLSRLFIMEHDYLPQSTDGSLDDAHVKNEHGQSNELFEIMIADIMSNHGEMYLPEGSLRQVWNLAKMARITQNVFSGTNENSAYYGQDSTGNALAYHLKKGVLSIRGISKILSAWKADGMTKELDYYVFNEYIGSVTETSDQVYLYRLFQTQGDFFNSNGWSPAPEGAEAKITNFNPVVPTNKSAQHVFMTPREVVDVMFGRDNAPERTKFPELSDTELSKISPDAASVIQTEQMGNMLERIDEYRETLTNLDKTLSKLGQTVELVCPIA